MIYFVEVLKNLPRFILVWWIALWFNFIFWIFIQYVITFVSFNFLKKKVSCNSQFFLIKILKSIFFKFQIWFFPQNLIFWIFFSVEFHFYLIIFLSALLAFRIILLTKLDCSPQLPFMKCRILKFFLSLNPLIIPSFLLFNY